MSFVVFQTIVCTCRTFQIQCSALICNITFSILSEWVLNCLRLDLVIVLGLYITKDHILALFLLDLVLRKKVEKLELKGLQIHKLIPEKLSGLEELLQDVFLILRPKPSDYHNRRDLIRVFNDISKELYGNFCVV